MEDKKKMDLSILLLKKYEHVGISTSYTPHAESATGLVARAHAVGLALAGPIIS